MAGAVRAFVLTLVLTMAAGCARKEPLLERWLAGAAGDADQAELVAEVRANRDVLEGPLIEAFRHGPSNARREAVEESVERVWSQAQVQLAELDAYALDDEDIAEMKALSLETEKRRARDRFEHNFRVGALLGLAITQGSAARALLTEVAADPSSPFRKLASTALTSQ